MEENDGIYLKYFVLNPNKPSAHGAASRKAIEVYAKEIRKANPRLALSLTDWMSKIRKTLLLQPGE